MAAQADEAQQWKFRGWEEGFAGSAEAAPDAVLSGAFVRQCCGAAARRVPERSWVADGRERDKTFGAAVVTQLFKTKLCSRDSAGRCGLPDRTVAHGAGELRHMSDLTKRVRCPDFYGRRCHNGNACTFAHHGAEMLIAEGEGKT